MRAHLPILVVLALVAVLFLARADAASHPVLPEKRAVEHVFAGLGKSFAMQFDKFSKHLATIGKVVTRQEDPGWPVHHVDPQIVACVNQVPMPACVQQRAGQLALEVLEADFRWILSDIIVMCDSCWQFASPYLSQVSKCFPQDTQSEISRGIDFMTNTVCSSSCGAPARSFLDSFDNVGACFAASEGCAGWLMPDAMGRWGRCSRAALAESQPSAG